MEITQDFTFFVCYFGMVKKGYIGENNRTLYVFFLCYLGMIKNREISVKITETGTLFSFSRRDDKNGEMFVEITESFAYFLAGFGWITQGTMSHNNRDFYVFFSVIWA